MANTMQVEIVSAESAIFSGRAEMVVAAGIEGDLGIKPHHTPLLTRLERGPVRIIVKEGGEEEIYYIEGGILEVQPHCVTVLADLVERAHTLDEAAALEAMKRAERAMQDKDADLDYAKAASELARAVAQLRTIKYLKQKLKK